MQIVTLYQREPTETGLIGSALERLYGGGLSFPEPPSGRPYVIANFVETIDGVVSFLIPGQSTGQAISGGSAEDRFVMGLLRSMADAVLIGAGTFESDPGHLWVPEEIYPEAKELYADLRRKLRKPPLPLNAVLTATGEVDLNERVFRAEGLKTLILTTQKGAARIAADHGDISPIALRSTGECGLATPEALLRILAAEFGVRLLLHEGGPTAFAQFLAAKLIDELFLTLAPQIAGRKPGAPRPSIAGETLFLPETAPWFQLQSVKHGSGCLLLRYAAR